MRSLNSRPGFCALIGLAFALSPVYASVVDRVVNCPTGTPCILLDRSLTGPAQYSDGTLDLLADATGGTLRGRASYQNGPLVGSGQLNGNAEWYDSLTAASATNPDGTQAYLTPTIRASGFTKGPANVQLTFILFGSNPIVESVVLSGDVLGTFKFDPVPIVIGPSGTFNFDLALSGRITAQAR